MRTWMLAPLGGAMTLASFALGFQWMFPDEDALRWARWKTEDSSRGTWAFDARDLDVTIFGAVALDDATLYKLERPRRVRGEQIPGAPVPMLTSPRVSARLELLPLLTGALMVALNADLYGGDLDMRVGQDGALRVIEGDLDGLDLSRVPLSGDEWTVDATGTAALVSDLQIDTEKIKESQGTLSLRFQDFKIAGGEIAGFKLEPMTFTEAVLAFEVEDGEAKVTQGKLVSDLLEATITGEITLNKDLRRMRMRLQFQLTLNEELDKLARFVPTLSDARDDDGVYHLILSGTPATARVRGDRLAARGDERPRSGRVNGPDGFQGPGQNGLGIGELPGEDGDPGVGEEEGDDDAASRRERRLERIRRARERRQQERDDEGQDGSPARPGGRTFEPMMPSRGGDDGQEPRGQGDMDEFGRPPDDEGPPEDGPPEEPEYDPFLDE